MHTSIKDKAMGFLGQEEKVSDSKFAEFKPNDDLPKGDSFGFFYFQNGSGKSAEYGDFITWQGVKVDLAAASPEAFIESATLIGFIPNTMLKNKQDNGAVAAHTLYRIEKAWDQGDKYDGNKKAKGFGYNMYRVNIDTELVNQLSALVVAPVAETPQVKI